MFHVPENYRLKPEDNKRFGSMPSTGNNGWFIIPSPTGDRRVLHALASDGLGWEHVSVHAEIGRGKTILIPYWSEMQFLKELFWDEEDEVMQIHPRRSQYVNYADCLHLWRPTNAVIPTPPMLLV